MFVDSHAHLQLPHYKKDLDAVLIRSVSEGIDNIMLVGSNEKDSASGVKLALQHDFLRASVGIHPHDVKTVTPATYKNLTALVKKYDVAAYGEIGLDFFKNYSPKDLQLEHFISQIDLADELALPLIVHIRDAYEECYEIFLKKKGKIKKGGVIHCFSSDSEHAKKFIDLGFHISFSCSITYKNSYKQVEALKNISTDIILIETDAPYLTPVPFRGKRNEPCYVKEVAKFIAKIKGLSVEDVARITARNFHSLFGAKKKEDAAEIDAEIVYKIRNSLYVNLTNDCTNDCSFCARSRSFVVKGHNLKLDNEPSVDDVIKLIGDPSKYDEVVFCGYGEPLIKLKNVIEIAKYVKQKGGKVRINTNGQGNMIHKRNILPSLKGIVDMISISLNAESEEKYDKFCHSIFGKEAYNGVKSFILRAKEVIPCVTVTVVDMPGIDVLACEKIAHQTLGVGFRARKLNDVG